LQWFLNNSKPEQPNPALEVPEQRVKHKPLHLHFCFHPSEAFVQPYLHLSSVHAKNTLIKFAVAFQFQYKVGITTPLYVMAIFPLFFSHLMVLPQAIMLKANLFHYFNSMFYLLCNYS